MANTGAIPLDLSVDEYGRLIIHLSKSTVTKIKKLAGSGGISLGSDPPNPLEACPMKPCEIKMSVKPLGEEVPVNE